MPLLSVKNVGKKYGENQVLKDININIGKGEIHGIIGENGAGKSTLMNILFGMPAIQATGGFEGEITLDGEVYNPKTPTEAMEKGIGMVHQEFMLIPGFKVYENIKLNRENTKDNLLSKIVGEKMKFLDIKAMKNDAKVALEKLDLKIEDETVVSGLPVGFLQFIEIAREIDKTNLKLLIVDEPTAVLTESEAEEFLKVLKNISNMGISILFITHRLDEIKDITDGITIIRDGEMVKSVATSEITVEEMAALMIGREVTTDRLNNRELDYNSLENVLELRNFIVNMPGESIKGIDLDIKKGEILGIAGLAGQGKIGISNGIMGIYPTAGTIKKDGKEIKTNSPKNSLDNSIAFLSEDRKGVGLLLDDPIDINIAVTSMEIKDDYINKLGPLKIVDKKGIREHALKMIEDLDIRCTGPDQNTRYLSGGNQQKVCIGRALTLRPEVLLISEPTRGIDIGAKNLVLETLVNLNKEEGTTIVITSSELAEMKQIADRIAIVSEGRITSILKPSDSDAMFGLAMSGKDINNGAVI